MSLPPISNLQQLFTAAGLAHNAVSSSNAKQVASESTSTASEVSSTPEQFLSDSAQTTNSQPSREQINQAMQEVQKALPSQARDLQFSIDNDTGRTVVKVVDPVTQDIIRQIPSEELLAITKAIDEFTGLLTKQKV